MMERRSDLIFLYIRSVKEEEPGESDWGETWRS